MEIPTNAAPVLIVSNLEYWRRAESTPMEIPTMLPTTKAEKPSTKLFAIAALRSGNTGRLPLIELPHSSAKKLPSQRKYCSGVDPIRP